MEPIVIVEGEDLTSLLDVLRDIAAGATIGPRGGIYRLRFMVDEGIKVKANEDVWTLNFGRVETPAPTVDERDRVLATAVLDVLLSVSERNAASGTTNPMLPRLYYNRLRDAFEAVWPGAYAKARRIEREEAAAATPIRDHLKEG